MPNINVEPAVSDRWADVEALLGQRGSLHGCWCMYFRGTPAERKNRWGEANRVALCQLVDHGAEPGLIAYVDGAPAGWASVAPREQFGRLQRSPVAKPVDDQPVWSLVCLFVDRRYRGQGIARALVRAAVSHAASRGASIVEAYPVDDTLGPVHPDEAYYGVVSLLAGEGFTEVARRRPRRPVMRRAVTSPAGQQLSG